MKINKLTFCLILVSLCSTSIAFGFVIGGSNLGVMGYPSFSSTHYSTPAIPYNRDRFSADQYEQEVNNYVRDAKEYIEFADNDISRIKDEKREAIDQANRVIRDYNNYINGY